MQIIETLYANQLPIQAYESGKLKINGEVFEHSLTVSFGQMPIPWPIQNILELTLANIEQLLAQKPEVILLGTGKQLIFPAFELLQEISHHGAGIEVMDTGAACRTYNLLLAEGRLVIAGLII